jgi:hypothetical protein
VARGGSAGGQIVLRVRLGAGSDDA